MTGLGKPQHRESLSAVGQGGRQAYAQRRWPWFELQEIRSWELAIKNSQPFNPFCATWKKKAGNNFIIKLQAIRARSSQMVCVDAEDSSPAWELSYLAKDLRGGKKGWCSWHQRLELLEKAWLHYSWIALLNEWKKRKKKRVLCCCASRALVAGSWLVQAGRNTTGFKSNCWHLQTSVTRAKGGEISILIRSCCREGECVWERSECVWVYGGGEDGGVSHPVTSTSCLIRNDPTKWKTSLLCNPSFQFDLIDCHLSINQFRQIGNTNPEQINASLTRWKKDKR